MNWLNICKRLRDAGLKQEQPVGSMVYPVDENGEWKDEPSLVTYRSDDSPPSPHLLSPTSDDLVALAREKGLTYVLMDVSDGEGEKHYCVLRNDCSVAVGQGTADTPREAIALAILKAVEE